MPRLIPYCEKIISDYLRAHEDVVGLGARVVGKTPSSHASPWVRVTQLDGRDASPPVEHNISFLVQLDCYAGATGGQPEANLLNRTVRSALRDMSGVHGDAVISRVRFTDNPRLPDTTFEPARERFILTATVHMHPVPAAA